MVQMVLGSVIKGTRPWKAFFLCLSALNIQRWAVFLVFFFLSKLRLWVVLTNYCNHKCTISMFSRLDSGL